MTPLPNLSNSIHFNLTTTHPTLQYQSFPSPPPPSLFPPIIVPTREAQGGRRETERKMERKTERRNIPGRGVQEEFQTARTHSSLSSFPHIFRYKQSHPCRFPPFHMLPLPNPNTETRAYTVH